MITGVAQAAEPKADATPPGLKMVKEFEQSGRKVLRYEHGDTGGKGKK